MSTLTVIKKRSIDIRKFISVELYCNTTDDDCESTRLFLNNKKIQFIEHLVDQDDALRTELEQKCNTQEVPQIFINNQHIGGYQDLINLNESKKLDVILGLLSDYKHLTDDQEQTRRITIITDEQ